MNSVTPCPPKITIFHIITHHHTPPIFSTFSLPQYIHTQPAFLSHSLYRSSPKKSIRVNSSHRLFPSSRTCSPPALDVIIFTHSFHRHYILFHRKQSSIDPTKTKSIRRVQHYISCHRNYLIWLVPSRFGILAIPSRHCNNFDSRLVAFKSPCKILAKSIPIRYTRPRHSSIIVLGVSSTTRPLPPRASSIIVTLSSFRPSPHAIPCFEKRLRKL